MPSQEQFEQFVAQYELTKEQLIVFFDKPMSHACRAFFTFRYFGYSNVAVLDGGYSKWAASKESLPQNPGALEVQVSPHEYGWKIISNKDAQVVVHIIKNGYWNNYVQQLECLDFRGEEEYAQQSLPGFRNLPFPKLLNEDQTFKSDEDLRAVFQQYKVSLNKTIIAQCLTGKMAAGGAFALYLLKVPCQLYDESLSGFNEAPELTQYEQDKIKFEGFL